MATAMDAGDDHPRVFRMPPLALALPAATVIACVATAAWFVRDLLGALHELPYDFEGRLFMATLAIPAASYVGLGALRRLGEPWFVSIDAAGLHFRRPLRGVRVVAWGDIAACRARYAWSDWVAMVVRLVRGTWTERPWHTTVTLLDSRGQTLATVSDRIWYFPNVIDEMERRLATRGVRLVVYEEPVDARRSARTDAGIASMSRFCAAQAAILAVVVLLSVYQVHGERRLRAHGTVINADVTGMLKDQERHWLYYAFTDARGVKYTRAALISPADWNEVQGKKQVAIIMLPSNPAWNRPVIGELAASRRGWGILIAGGGIAAAFVAASLTIRFGLVITRDDDTYVYTVFGRRIWTRAARSRATEQAKDEAEAPLPPPTPSAVTSAGSWTARYAALTGRGMETSTSSSSTSRGAT
jgi:hypothetical protein